MPSTERLREYVAIEMDLGGLDEALAHLIRRVQATGLAGIARSCLELREARLAVRQVLARLSKPIAEASATYNREHGRTAKRPPPF